MGLEGKDWAEAVRDRNAADSANNVCFSFRVLVILDPLIVIITTGSTVVREIRVRRKSVKYAVAVK
jgi:hypothetical protein